MAAAASRPTRIPDGRLTPDVAAVADPFTGVRIVLNQQELVGGGTSQSAPIWAGMAAVMNQYLIANGGRALGDLNPMLYRIAAGAPLPGFRDVALGGNAVANAGPGYDMVTGLGTPDVDNLVRNCCSSAEGDPMSTARQTTSKSPPRNAGYVRRMSRRASTAGCADATSPPARGRPRLAAHPRLRRRAGRTPAAAVVGELTVPAPAAAVTHRVPGRARGGARSAGRVRAAAVACRALTVAALGVPFLFLLYLRESDAFADIPARTWVLTAALGIGLGVGWVLLTGAVVARSYGIALGADVVGARMLQTASGSRWAG